MLLDNKVSLKICIFRPRTMNDVCMDRTNHAKSRTLGLHPLQTDSLIMRLGPFELTLARSFSRLMTMWLNKGGEIPNGISGSQFVRR